MSYAYNFNQAKVDAVLPKAKDLERVGKAQDAFVLLSNCLTQKRNVKTWTPQIEEAVMKFIDLAIKLRSKSHELRSVLLTYKSCTATTPIYLTKVLRHLLEASEKTFSPLLASALEMDEEFEDDTPEALATFAFSDFSENLKRKDRQRQNPSLRFFWEMFRVVLELLRSTRFQEMYHDIARNIFVLCAKYKRKNEFRRFTLLIREHVASALVQPALAGEPDTAAEAHRLYLKTRLDQLNTASALELWSEAYTTISDIHDTIRQTHSPVAAYPTLLHIYEKLASFFWSSRDYLLTAYAIHQFQRLAETAPDAHAEALKDAAENSLLHATQEDLFSYIVLSCLLARPSASNDNSLLANQDPSLRFSSLLGLAHGVVPSRTHLLANISSSGILNKVNAHTATLYKVLEKPTSPLAMKRTAATAITSLSASPFLAHFVQPIYDLMVVRVLQRLGDVYTVVTMHHLSTLVPDMTWAAVEKIILTAINSNLVHVRIDHRDQVLHFSSPSLEIPPLCSQLSRLSASLAPIIERVMADSTAEREEVRASVFKIVRDNLDADHDRVLDRKEEIYKRKEIEEATQRKAAFDIRAAQELAMENKRLDEEAARERERLRAEKEVRDRAHAEQELKKKQEMAEVLAKTMTEGSQQTKAAKKVANLTSNLTDASQEDLIEASRKLIAQQKAEREKRLTDERKNLDYLTRACRMVERDMLTENQGKLESEAKEQHAAAIEEYMARHKANYEHARAEKARLGRMLESRDAFAAKFIADRKAQHEQDLAEYKVKKIEYDAANAERLAAEAKAEAEAEAAYEIEQEAKRVAEAAEAERQRAHEIANPKAYVPAHLRGRK